MMENESFEKRSQIIFERSDTDKINVNGELIGKIIGYRFHILIRDKAPLDGILSREDVELIYELYSSEGANLTQREVARYFPKYTFQEFKRILRAFNITKACSPIAPHQFEERDVEDLITITLQNKENNYLRRIEHERNRLIEAKFKETLKKYDDLRKEVEDFKCFLSDINIEFDLKIPIAHPDNPTDNTLLVYLSDMHIGADVSKYSIYSNEYNEKVVMHRMEQVINRIYELAIEFKCSNIIVCNLGDSLDGYNAETTRGGHILPQNMDNKDQFKNFLQVMIELFSSLSTCGIFQSIQYVVVDGGNHDGDVGYIANKALIASLEVLNPQIKSIIFDKFIDFFTVNKHTFILCHGKDAVDMFKNMPLTLNVKTENQINEFIDYNQLSGNIHFIKGDLHQSATTYGRRFRYKSVGSFFGSSAWMHKNFGLTLPSVDFDILKDDTIFETKLILYP